MTITIAADESTLSLVSKWDYTCELAREMVAGNREAELDHVVETRAAIVAALRNRRALSAISRCNECAANVSTTDFDLGLCPTCGGQLKRGW
jgi:hypothetical protein